MDDETVKQVMEAISGSYWKLNYQQFCDIINQGRDDYWSEEKWRAWVNLNSALSQFDSESITQLVNGVNKSG